MTQTPIKSDADFIRDLKESMDAVWAVARYLNERGYTVVMNPLKVRGSYEQRQAYKDDGDIIVATKTGYKYCEVKHTSTPFTNEYPYLTLIVDSVSAFHSKKHRPVYYFIVNPAITHMMIINVDMTYATWEKVTIKNHGDKKFYMIPRHMGDIARMGVD